MGLEIAKKLPEIVIGYERLRRSGFGSHMFCLAHGQNPPVRQLLMAGELFIICQACIQEACEIGWIDRRTEA